MHSAEIDSPSLSPPCNAPLPPPCLLLLYCNAFIGSPPPLSPCCALYNGPATSVRPAGSSVQGIGLPPPSPPSAPPSQITPHPHLPAVPIQWAIHFICRPGPGLYSSSLGRGV